MIDATVQVEVVFGAYAFVETSEFEQRPALGTDLPRLAAAVKAHYARNPAGWFQQSQQKMDGGCFSGSVGTQEAEDDPCRNLQRKIVHCFDGTKSPG